MSHPNDIRPSHFAFSFVLSLHVHVHRIAAFVAV